MGTVSYLPWARPPEPETHRHARRAVKATLRAMRDQRAAWKHMLCRTCGATYSANPGDYFARDLDEPIMCCGHRACRLIPRKRH